MAVDARNRLQPALLDRLTDDSRGDRVESEDHRVMSKAQLRQAVLRDLGALFNAVQPLGPAAEHYPMLSGSVLNFGLPPLSGQLASKLDVSVLETAIRQAIVRFEPRILPDTLLVRALEATTVLDTHNVIEFEIRGHLWSQPVPLEILLRTQLDLEAGQVQVRDGVNRVGRGPGTAS
jgi:type VI secretion system protein ImpF